MRIRIDINEMSAMAEALQVGATAIAEVGVEVCSCDLPAGVANLFEQHRASFRKTFDDLATEYRLHAMTLLLRAIIATKDVNKAVAIYPPPEPPRLAPTTMAMAPAFASSSGNYDPSKYYSPGSAAYNRLTPAEKKMNDMAGQALVMPLVWSNYRKSEEKLNATMSSMFEMSTSDLERKLGRYPTAADREYYTPNTYKSRYGS